MPTYDEIKAATLDAINELVSEFRKSPYMYLYEADLRGMLLAKLRMRIPEPIRVPRALSKSGTQLNDYELAPVTSEYQGKIDVACLDSPEIQKRRSSYLNHGPGSDIYIYQLPIYVGIELKYRKMGDVFGFDKCISDFEKLAKRPVPFPVTIGFIQDQNDEDDFFATKGPWHKKAVEKLDTSSLSHSICVVSQDRIWLCTRATCNRHAAPIVAMLARPNERYAPLTALAGATLTKTDSSSRRAQ